MNKEKKYKILNILLSLGTILFIFLAWLLSSIIINESIILPTPIESIKEMFYLFGDSEFLINILCTLGRSVLAFVLSFSLALVLAIVSKFYGLSKPIIKVFVSILRALPTIAVILLLLLWSTSNTAAIVVTMLVLLPTMYSAMSTTINLVDYDIMAMLDLYGVRKKDKFKKYIFPIILPSMLSNIGSGLSLNIKLIVAAEVIASTARSIGNMMNEAKIYFETTTLFALVLVMVIISVLIELLFSKISEKVGKKYASK